MKAGLLIIILGTISSLTHAQSRFSLGSGLVASMKSTLRPLYKNKMDPSHFIDLTYAHSISKRLELGISAEIARQKNLSISPLDSRVKFSEQQFGFSLSTQGRVYVLKGKIPTFIEAGLLIQAVWDNQTIGSYPNPYDSELRNGNGQIQEVYSIIVLESKENRPFSKRLTPAYLGSIGCMYPFSSRFTAELSIHAFNTFKTSHNGNPNLRAKLRLGINYHIS